MYKAILVLSSFIVLFVIIASMFLRTLTMPFNQDDRSKVEFVVNPGTKIDKIAEDLSSKNLIRSKLVFKIIILRFNLGQKIQAGYFYFSPSQSTVEIANGLTHSQAKAITITIPEGLRREEIANLISEKLISAKFKNQFDPDNFIKGTRDLEGQLFPNTYTFAENFTTEDIISKLTKQFKLVQDELGISPENLNKVLVLGSLLEREAANDLEKPIISGILLNRLNGDWPLQIDATVQYSLSTQRCRTRQCDWWPKNLSKDDLQINSSYNTYKNTGLPPKPICSPGKESLKAANSPQSTNYWFYLHSPDGKIHYATSIKEHNQNVCLFLKKC